MIIGVVLDCRCSCVILSSEFCCRLLISSFDSRLAVLLWDCDLVFVIDFDVILVRCLLAILVHCRCLQSCDRVCWKRNLFSLFTLLVKHLGFLIFCFPSLVTYSSGDSI